MFMMVMLGLLDDSHHLSALGVYYLLPTIRLYLPPTRHIMIIRVGHGVDSRNAYSVVD